MGEPVAQAQPPPPARDGPAAAAPPSSPLAEKEREIRHLRRKLEQAQKEKGELERHVQAQEPPHLTQQALHRKLETLKIEQTRLSQSKVDLENTMEQEQEFIVNRLQKKTAGLEGEKEELQAQVAELRAATQRLHREKVHLENQMESEEEAIVNRLQRQIEHLLAKYKALEAFAQSHGLDCSHIVAPGGRDPTLESSLEWAYTRTPSLASRAGSEPGSTRPSMSGGSSHLGGRSASPRPTEPATPH